MKLELSEEKTRVTHANDGFDFLGFHIRKYKGVKAVLIRPTKSNIQRMRDTISRYFDRRNHEASVTDIIVAINPILRGWANYYRFVNSKATLQEIQFYTFQKFMKWYRGKYRMNMKEGTMRGEEWIRRDNLLHIYNAAAETKVQRYMPKKGRLTNNPYLESEMSREEPLEAVKWFGKSNRDGDLRNECFKRDMGICQLCMGCRTDIDAHHITPLEEGGIDTLENLITLCEKCHYKVHHEIGWQEYKRLVESRVRSKAQARFGAERMGNTLGN
jgi:hypothetical protein